MREREVPDAGARLVSGVQNRRRAAREAPPRLVLAERLPEADPAVPLHRMALLYPVAEPYALIAHQQLAAAGIPSNGPAGRRLRETLSGTTLLGLLALPDGDFRRDRARWSDLASKGWRIVYATWADTKQPAALIERLEAALAA